MYKTRFFAVLILLGLFFLTVVVEKDFLINTMTFEKDDSEIQDIILLNEDDLYESSSFISRNDDKIVDIFNHLTIYKNSFNYDLYSNVDHDVSLEDYVTTDYAIILYVSNIDKLNEDSTNLIIKNYKELGYNFVDLKSKNY